MGYEQDKATQDRLYAEYEATGVIIRQFPHLANGLITDEAKATPEYKAARANCDKAFAALRNFNETFTKIYRKQIQAARSNRVGV